MTLPKSATVISEGVTCFKSKNKSQFSDFYPNCTGILIELDNNENHSKVVGDYLVALNILRQEYTSIQWFSQQDINKFVLKDEINPEKFISDNIDSNVNGFGYQEDFNDVSLHVVAAIKFSYSLIELYQNISNLENGTFLNNAIRFLSINNCVRMTTIKIYDNALLENSTLFQLFEAFLNEYEPIDESKIEECEKCDKQKRPGIGTRVKAYLEKQGITDPLIVKAFGTIASGRHKFFHSLKGKTVTQYVNAVIEGKETNDISFEEEIKKGGGILTVHGIFKAFLTDIIITKLQEKNGA